MNTEWELGAPPSMLEIDVFAYGHVRRGFRQGSTFVLVDCTHPAQNMVLDVERIDAWRARNSIVVIEQQPYGYPHQFQPQGLSFLCEMFGF